MCHKKLSYSIPEPPIDSFDWIRWRCGADIWVMLGCHPRYCSIMENKEVILKYTVGYISSHKLLCRPKLNDIAVMFVVNGVTGWTHLHQREFEEIFSVR